MAGPTIEFLKAASNLNYPLDSDMYQRHARIIAQTIREGLMNIEVLTEAGDLPSSVKYRALELTADALFVIIPKSISGLKIGDLNFSRGPKMKKDDIFWDIGDLRSYAENLLKSVPVKK